MAKKKKPVEEVEPEAKAARRKIIDVVVELFTEDPEISTQEVIDGVKAEFPQSKINKKHVSWYRGNLRAKGMNIPKARGNKVEEPEDAEPTKSKGKNKGKNKKSKK